MTSSPASADFLPNTLTIAAPTSWAFGGSSFSLSVTCCMASTMVMLPASRSSCIFLPEMPISSRAFCVLADILRIRIPASVMPFMAFSSKSPSLVLTRIAINSSAAIPASLNAPAYFSMFPIMLPCMFAPKTTPSFIISIVSFHEMPNWLARVLAAPIVSSKPSFMVSARACTLERMSRISSPTSPEKFFVSKEALSRPLLYSYHHLTAVAAPAIPRNVSTHGFASNPSSVLPNALIFTPRPSHTSPSDLMDISDEAKLSLMPMRDSICPARSSFVFFVSLRASLSFFCSSLAFFASSARSFSC